MWSVEKGKRPLRIVEARNLAEVLSVKLERILQTNERLSSLMKVEMLSSHVSHMTKQWMLTHRYFEDIGISDAHSARFREVLEATSTDLQQLTDVSRAWRQALSAPENEDQARGVDSEA